MMKEDNDEMFAKGFECIMEAIHNWDKRKKRIMDYYTENRIYLRPSREKDRALNIILKLEIRISRSLQFLHTYKNQQREINEILKDLHIGYTK